MAKCKIVAIEQLSLDGVYQAPGRTDEDTRDGFTHGGWAAAGNEDPKMQEAMSKYMGGSWSLVVGETTYEDFYEAWPTRQPDHPMTKALTSVQKFVASYNPNYDLPWENSTLLKGDAAEALAKLKEEHDKTLIIMGSGVLVRSLMERGLVDEFLIMVHPLVIGEGRRFFDGAPFTKFKLTDEFTASTGVIAAAYQLVADSKAA